MWKVETHYLSNVAVANVVNEGVVRLDCEDVRVYGVKFYHRHQGPPSTQRLTRHLLK